MRGMPGVARFQQLVGRWLDAASIAPARWPGHSAWAYRFLKGSAQPPYRTGADLRAIQGWEHRYGYPFPRALRSWLLISDGLYKNGPLIHPLTAIGPMIPFARVPDLIVQPESWFELGNPGTETVCIDLGYRWPDGDCPIFASGDDVRGTLPRVIAASFVDWFLRLLDEGGREFWLDDDFVPLGDPWAEHRLRTPAPDLPERLQSLAQQVRPLMEGGVDDRRIATELGITRGEVEAIFRHLQHVPSPMTGP